MRPTTCTFRSAALLVAAITIAIALAGCAAPPQSTRMTVDDFNAMAEEMAQSMARSEALRQRGPDSDPWVVSIDRVLNLSSDVMTVSEQWAIVARLRAASAMQLLGEDRNVRFVMAPEQATAMWQNDDELATAFADRPMPTHTMTATFRSATRAYATGRSEAYYCEFELIDLATGEPAWSDRFEYKREARGHLWD